MKRVIALGLLVLGATQLRADLTDYGNKVKALYEQGKVYAEPAKVYPTTTQTSVEIKNKSGDITVSFLVDGVKYTRNDKDTFHVPSQNHKGFTLDIAKPIQVQILTKGASPLPDGPAIRYNLKPGKTGYVTWDGQKLRPQTGPAMGRLGKTDTGLTLANNVSAGDVTPA